MKKKTGVIIGIAVVGVLAAVYFGIAFYYSSHLFGNTRVGGVSYGNLTPAEAEARRNTEDMQYSLKLLGRDGAEAMLTAQDIGFTCVYNKTMGQIKQEQNPFLWPLSLFSAEDHAPERTVSFDRGLLTAKLNTISFLQEENMVQPKDAYLGGFDAAEHRYVIVPEEEGTVIVQERLQQSLQDALQQHLEQVDLDASGCYQKPTVCADDPKLVEQLAKKNSFTASEVTLTFGEDTEVVDFSVFGDWVDEVNGSVSLNEAKVSEYVEEIDEKYSTYRKDENFTTVDGYLLKLPKGDFGWKINVEAETEQMKEDLLTGKKMSREPVWTSQGASFGESDIGDFYVEVDITNQTVYVVDKGEVVFTTLCVTGNEAKKCDTPAGIHAVFYKARNAVLRGPDYATPVKYWMPFNKGIGLHDASWRSRFGGTIYKYSGSHGCVNLPTSAAAKIYDYVYVGCPVICYYLDERYIVSEPEPEEPEPTEEPSATPTPTPEPTIIEEEPTLAPTQAADVPVFPEGTVFLPDGTFLLPDGIILYPDGTAVYPGGMIVYPDGTVVDPNAPATTPAPTPAADPNVPAADPNAQAAPVQ